MPPKITSKENKMFESSEKRAIFQIKKITLISIIVTPT